VRSEGRPYPSGDMAEFQWWLLIVGLVAGGGLVAVVSMDSRRREDDISELERQAEATWIADQLAYREAVDPATVEAVLRAHREYLSLLPPDRLIVEEADAEEAPPLGVGAALPDAAAVLPDDLDRDPDREPHDVGDDGRCGPDEDLPPAAEQRASAREQAHAGADREQRGD
jgi:hypothetical protein